MDMGNVNPVTGPVYVKGAEPGDTLQVEILELAPNDWGWTAIIPEFGLLADEFPDPWLNISQRRRRRPTTVRFNDQITLPFAPFPGTIGLAPKEPGAHSVLPPDQVGREHGHQAPHRRHHAVPAGRRRKAPCSASATPTRRWATPRSAAPRSSRR